MGVEEQKNNHETRNRKENGEKGGCDDRAGGSGTSFKNAMGT